METSFVDWVGSLGTGTLALSLAVVLSLVLLAAGSALRSRSRYRNDLRAVVRAIEELRSGRGRGSTELESTSSLSMVGDAVQRLGADLHHTWAESQTAAERWRAVTDATRDTAIITTDTDGDVRSFSAGAAQLTGWEEAEVISRPAAVLFDEHAYKDLLPKLARKSLRSKGITTRSSMMRRDGTSFDAEVSVRLLMGSAKQPVGFMMLVRDVTEQLCMENDLRESERRYRGLIESLTQGVILLRESRVVYANPAAERLCGTKASELVGSVWRQRIATRDLLLLEEAIRAVEQGLSQREGVEAVLLDSLGREMAEIHIDACAVEFAGGSATMLLLRDETDRRRVERALRVNERRLDAVLEATSDALLVLSEDPTNLVQMTNRSFADLMGVDATELLGTSEDRLLRLLHEAGEGGAVLASRIAARDGAGWEERVVWESGAPREFNVGLMPLRSASGSPLGWVMVCHDVTRQAQSERESRKQAEELQLGKLELERSCAELGRINAELAQRGDDLDALNGELRRLDRMKSELIGNVSHELQTPLVSIRGYAELMLKERLGPVSEEQRKGLQLSLKNIDRLIGMIDNLLVMSRKEQRVPELKLARFGIKSLIDESVSLMKDPIESRKIDVSVQLERDEILIQADRDKIQQVMLNLLSNAIKFSPERGLVEIGVAAASGSHVVVSVRDHGVGIEAESVGRIFERHYQADRRQSKDDSGAGIGLSIVREILGLHGCKIDVESEPGRGSTFRFTLPLAVESIGAAPTTAPRPDAGGASERAPTETPPTNEPVSSRPRLRIIRRHRSDR